MHNFNVFLFNTINSAVGYYSTLDQIMLFVTTYATYGVIMIVLMYKLIWLPWRATLSDRLSKLAQGFECVGALFLTWFTVQMIKVLVAHPRPFHVFKEIVTLIPDQDGYSFPSLHAALTVATATLCIWYDRRLGVVLYLFAFLVSISRIYVGVHYPVDIVVGAILGICIPYIVHRLFLQIAHRSV